MALGRGGIDLAVVDPRPTEGLREAFSHRIMTHFDRVVLGDDTGNVVASGATDAGLDVTIVEQIRSPR